jgi:putative DNA primase/helicase
MRQDYFEYWPQFKLLIAGNSRPGLRNVDEAIRARFNLLPFTAVITAKERDKDFPKKLEAEWPGILAWAIKGCLEWRKQKGLKPPQVVLAATNQYLANEDNFWRWFEQACVKSLNGWESIGRLFDSWVGWCEANGEFAGSSKRFSQRLEDAGFTPLRLNEKSRKGRGFKGLQLQGLENFVIAGVVVSRRA